MKSDQKRWWLALVVFLVINFAALAIGGLFTGKGVPSEWYAQLSKAPWTPPGWVFGFAWTTIMICFSIYMASWYRREAARQLLFGLFGLQWLLNVSWNPVFFYWHQVALGLVVIISLTVLIGFLIWRNRRLVGSQTIYLLPYFLWLLIATSLNAFIWAFN